MNKFLLYRPASKATSVAAFAFAVLLHLSAFAFGSFHREPKTSPVPDSFPTVEGRDSPPEITPDLEIESVPESAPNAANDEFADTQPFAPRRNVKSHRWTPTGPAGPPRQGGSGIVNVKANTLSAPRPEYPYEARRRHLIGSGVAVLSLDLGSGVVVAARMERSTGDPILDNSAVSAFRRWRFKPGPALVRIPVTFSLAGVSTN